MSKVNPILLYQMLMHYSHYHDQEARTFRFTRNNRMHVHKETAEETERRKSHVNPGVRTLAISELYRMMAEALKDRIGPVWIENPEQIRRIAVPVGNSTGESGFGVRPTGSRIVIPEKKKIRAFTYWELVNDIDLSCIGLTEEGRHQEFSWRTMFSKQSEAITFSGDQTSGYHGGSEFFDVDVQKFRREHPDIRWLIFCDNIYSPDKTYKDVFATGGFMTRDRISSGEVFEPKTVETSFILTADSNFCYMFAIDLQDSEMIWLNMARSDRTAVAGRTDVKFLMDYLDVTKIFNAYDLITASATKVVDTPEEAEWIVSDNLVIEAEGKTVVRSWDQETMLKLLQPR